MGFLDFLKKKPSDSATAPMNSMSSSSVSVPQAPSGMGNGSFDLPDLPSFDDAAPSTQSGMNLDLPPIPSFNAQADISPPAEFTLTDSSSTMTSNDAMQPPAFPSVNSESDEILMPPALSNVSEKKVEKVSRKTVSSQPIESDVDVRTPFGPVFCDVETYRAILSNLNYAKDEINQLQTFSENSKQLHSKSQAQFDSFHSSLSAMAKKLLMAEAKLFR